MNRLPQRLLSVALFILSTAHSACYYNGTNVSYIRRELSYAHELIKADCGGPITRSGGFSRPVMGKDGIIIEIKIRVTGYDKDQRPTPECIETFKKNGDSLAAAMRADFLANPDFKDLAADCRVKEIDGGIFSICAFYDPDKVTVHPGDFVRDGNLD